MPIPIISNILFDDLTIPYTSTLIKLAITIGTIYLLKIWFSGAINQEGRVLHGKVAIITGGTSGIGGAVAQGLAEAGCQLVLLTRHPLSDPFLVDYVEDLRNRTGNELISLEHVDLAELHSVRKFATKWIDNAPPRRLDLVVLCADEMTPPGSKLAKSKDGEERMTAVNYLANFHLLSILSPALKAQPKDRDVRVIMGVCASYMAGELGDLAGSDEEQPKGKKGKHPVSISTPPTVGKVYGSTKLAVLAFCAALQKHLSSTGKPVAFPPNQRVICVDPGWTRTAGMLRYLTRGSLWGLLFYIVTYPLWWLVLKSATQGAQSFLYAAMNGQFFGEEDPQLILIKECKVARIMRDEVRDEKTQKNLWEATEKRIEVLEKDSAIKRSKEKQQEAKSAAKSSKKT
jgi:NAD(P)-dependent dehydrogenase (short-subunit alcohol dehydrogenase family)